MPVLPVGCCLVGVRGEASVRNQKEGTDDGTYVQKRKPQKVLEQAGCSLGPCSVQLLGCEHLMLAKRGLLPTLML